MPPAVQGPIGLARDRDFAAPEQAGVVEYFAGFWNGVPVFRERGPKPIWIRSERAIANEKLAAKRGAARGDIPITVIDDGVPDHRPYSWDDRDPK
jgi:hypothetical protein